jgi:glutaconate CoA-transferase, subunit B
VTRPTPTEVMTVAAARRLADGVTCFVGIGLPSTAANLARLTHAPNILLVYESGAVGAKPRVLPMSIGDGELASTADTVVPTPEIFRYRLQGGRIDVGFLGAAQIDRFGNLNTTVIGDYDSPATRLPGGGGAPEIAAAAREVIVVMQHSTRSFVERLDFVTSVGFLDGGGSRERLGLTGGGPSAVVTDLCVMAPMPSSNELGVVDVHPGVTQDQVRASTGWDIRFADSVRETPLPSDTELAVLRDLQARAAAAHGAKQVRR